MAQPPRLGPFATDAQKLSELLSKLAVLRLGVRWWLPHIARLEKCEDALDEIAAHRKTDVFRTVPGCDQAKMYQQLILNQIHNTERRTQTQPTLVRLLFFPDGHCLRFADGEYR
jgi:hypothetical protein